MRGWMHEACVTQMMGPPQSAPRSALEVKPVLAAILGVLVLAVIAATLPDPKKAAERTKTPAPVRYSVAAEWQKDRELWQAVVVPAGTSDAQLCALGKWLHQENWLSQFQFFDDSARVAEYVSWTKAYPAYRRPKALVDWMGVHHRGLLRPETADTWELYTVTGDSPASRVEYPCSMPRR